MKLIKFIFFLLLLISCLFLFNQNRILKKEYRKSYYQILTQKRIINYQQELLFLNRDVIYEYSKEHKICSNLLFQCSVK